MSPQSDHVPGAVRAWRDHLIHGTRRLAVSARLASRRLLYLWLRLRPPQQLVLGFLSYALLGALLLATPAAQRQSASLLDHLFVAVSAVSTTGLSTLSVADDYTRFGQVVLLILFQLGGIGYMTFSSVLVLARGRPLSDCRMGVLSAGFSLPSNFVLPRFLIHVGVFTILVETVGAAALWWRFEALGVEDAGWSAIFHTVSAFATAGFGLHNDSLEAFRGDAVVNLIISVLCYLGAIGFIVVQDVWYSLKFRERMLTFTSRVILLMTAGIFLVSLVALLIIEPALRDLPPGERVLTAAFQVMSASSTAGFNTIPISAMSTAGILVLMISMLIGASPAGTGGGIKTTSVSAIAANAMSILRTRDRVTLLGHEVPLARLLAAEASATMYLVTLALGVLALSLTESQEFLHLVFEAGSALGTVGLSMGITGELTWAGKVVIILLMFAGRCGPLTLGYALMRPDGPTANLRRDDLAV